MIQVKPIMRKVILTALLLGLTTPVASGRQVQSPLLFGAVPQYDATRMADIWHPLLAELTKRTGIPIRFDAANSIPDFERALEKGTYDLAYMNPYHLILSNKRQGYQPVLRDTHGSLTGILVVKKGSPFTSPNQLDGQAIAYPSANALGASIMIRRDLATLYSINTRSEYVRSHTSVYLNVISGSYAAGGGVLKTFAALAPELRDQLRIIHTSQELPPHPIAIHPRVAHDIAAKLIKAFVELNHSEDGRTLLQQIPIGQLGAASLDEYSSLQKLDLRPFYQSD